VFSVGNILGAFGDFSGKIRFLIDRISLLRSHETMEYQNHNRYFAQVAGSLESHAKAELEEFGARIIQEVPRGIAFRCDTQTLYRIVYGSRLVQRILAPLVSFNCHSEKYLFSQAGKALDWTSLFSLTQSFGIESNVSASHINHSLYAGQLLKDAICDQFRAKYDQRPDFKSSGADINFNLHLRNNRATLSLDITGSMHKRGYRSGGGEAPLQETLAAAIIRLTGWKGEKPLLDPMCGSGTLLAEALMSQCQIPASHLHSDRDLRNLPDFDAALWQQVRSELDSRIIPLPEGLISGSDQNPQSVRIAQTNLRQLPFGEKVGFQTSRFQDLPVSGSKCIITNPPYGIRLGDDSSTRRLYNELGDFLKRKCPDSEAYVLCGSKELVPELRLRAHWKKSLKNGNLEVKLAKIIIK